MMAVKCERELTEALVALQAHMLYSGKKQAQTNPQNWLHQQAATNAGKAMGKTGRGLDNPSALHFSTSLMACLWASCFIMCIVINLFITQR